MKFSLSDIVDILSLFQLLMLSGVLGITTRGRRGSNVILAVFLIIQCNCMMNSLVWRHFHWFYTHCPHLFYMNSSPLYLLGPALFLFTRSWTTRGPVFKKSDGFILLPFMGHLSFLTFKFHRFSGAVKQTLLDENRVLTSAEYHITEIGLFLMLLCSAVLIVRCLHGYNKTIRNNYSSTSRSGLRWLVFVNGGFIGLWLTDIIEYFYFQCTGLHSLIVDIGHPIVFFLATVMVFKALIHPEVFLGSEPGGKHAKYPMTETEKNSYIQRLTEAIKNRKPHLIPELNLMDLSKQAGVPPRYLSQVLNESFGQNFYDFINRHRIEESKQVLRDPGKQKCTILEIAFESGFNSKVAFNVAFKKYTGMTPKQYRRFSTRPKLFGSGTRT